jgi:hypothetical protein
MKECAGLGTRQSNAAAFRSPTHAILNLRRCFRAAQRSSDETT